MWNKVFSKCISFIITLLLIFQSTIGVYAAPNHLSFKINDVQNKQKIENNLHNVQNQQTPDNDQDNVKASKKLKQKPLATKKNNKIPKGISKDQSKFEKWKNKKELKGKRTNNSKTYLNKDGSKTTVVFFEPIHVEEKGEYVDIDNNLIATEKYKNGFAYKTKKGIIDTYFTKEKNGEGMIILEDKNITVELVPKDTKGDEIVVEGNNVLFPTDNKLITYLYTVHNKGVKEDIILENYTNKNTFEYELKTKGPVEVLAEDNMIKIIDKRDSKEIFVMSAPAMSDKEGNRSEDLKLELQKEKGGYKLTLTADEGWLKDSARIYPVYIDPGIEKITDVDDTYVQERYDTTQSSAEMIYVGYDGKDGSTNGEYYKNRTRGFIKFDLPADITTDTQIGEAKLHLYKYTRWTNTNRNVKASRAIEDMSYRNMKWNNFPSASSPKAITSIGLDKGWYDWDIKEIINHWIAYDDNYGLVLTMEDEYAKAACFVSTNAPGNTNNSAIQSSKYNTPYVEIKYSTDPQEPPTPGDEGLILERNDIMENGTAYFKNSFTHSSSDGHKGTITYRLMPDNISNTIEDSDFSTWNWETDHYDLEQDKLYWIEADIQVEDWVPPVPIYDDEGNETGEIPGYYEESYSDTMTSDKFLVYQVQPGDTLKRIVKHYLGDGNRYTELVELNKLETEKLIVGQRLFAITEIEKPYNYKQPETITSEIELNDYVNGSSPVNTEILAQYVNSHTGGFIYSPTDFSYTSYNMPLSFVRSYSSKLENRKSPLGDKWDYSFNKYLYFYQDGTIGYNTGDGSRLYFKGSGSRYTTDIPTYFTLYDRSDYYEMKMTGNVRYTFDKTTGLLTTMIDKNDNTTTINYNENDWQTSIVDKTQRQISIEYYEDKWIGNIKTVEMPDNTTIQFTYEEGNNNLNQFINGEGYDTAYNYNENQLLESIILPEGNRIIKNKYLPDGSVDVQYDGKNNDVNFEYSTNRTVFTDGNDNEYEYTYNNNYWLEEKNFPDDENETYRYYEDSGEIKEFINRMEQHYKYEYNEQGYITKLTKPNRKYSEYRYEDGYLIKYIRDFEGNIKELAYDSNNNLNKIYEYVTEEGIEKTITTDYDYSPEGLLERIDGPDDVTTFIDNSGYPYIQVLKDENRNKYTYYYDSMGRIVTALDPKHNETRYSYDDNGNIKLIRYPSTYDTERYVEYDYDKNGNLEYKSSSRYIPGEGYPTFEYNYDDNDRLEWVQDPYGYIVEYDYDGNGNLEFKVDQEDYPTAYIYNRLNQLKEIKYLEDISQIDNIDDIKPSIRYTYNDIGDIEKIKESDGTYVDYDYDYTNNIVTILKPEGYEEINYYDEMGNLKKHVLPNKNEVEYELDELYRVKRISEPGNKETEIKYTDSGNISEIVDNDLITYIYDYYDDGRLKKITERFVDKFNEKTEQTNEDLLVLANKKSSISLGENEINRLNTQGETETSNNVVTYTKVFTYDENGNIETVEDEEGNITTYKYNELNKVEKIIDPLQKTKELYYDEDGNIKKIVDGEDNEKLIEYDALNRLYQVKVPSIEDTEYTYLYNGRGLLENYIDPRDNITTYDYDKKGRLDYVKNPKNEYTYYDFYDDGTLKKIIYPNQETVEYDYDKLNRIEYYKDRSGVEYTLHHTVMGQLDYVEDTVGNINDYKYDELGRLEEITDNIGRTKSFTYNEMNKIETVKDIDSTITTYHYDSKGRVREINDPENKITKLNYTARNQVSKVEKPGSRIYKYDYDQSGNLWKVTDPLNNVTEYLYNDNNLVEEIINAREYSKKYTYNALNKLETVTNERDYTTHYDYYPGGYLKSIKDPKNYATEYTYDELNRTRTIENPLHEKTTYTYDNMGLIKTIEDERGVKTTYSYTSRDQIAKIMDTDGNEIERMYYPNGDLWKIIDQEDRVTEYIWDAVHRVEKIIEPGGYEQNFQYDPVNQNLKAVYDNMGQRTDYTYDRMHRLLTERDEQENETVYTYDDFGNLKTKETPDDKITTYGYDELDRITSILDPEKKLTKLDYDAVGNIDYITKPNKITYDYQYDEASNIEKISDSLGNETIFTYDPNNNIETMTDPLGNQYTYVYDGLNRLKEVQDLLGNSDGYHYDESGNIDQITDGNNNTTYYHYNRLNRLEWVKDAEGNLTRYTYYDDGKLKTMKDARNNTTEYKYSDAGHLEKIINPLGEVKEFQYTLLGQIDKVIKPDGNEIDYIYDEFNRLDTILYPDDSTVEYMYDDLNRKKAMKDINGVTNYNYDDMGRLNYVSDSTGEEVKYEYDDRGRKTKVIYPDGKYVRYGYDEHDRLETVIDREKRITKYSYDNQGRLKTIERPNDVTTTYIYSEANRIDTIINTDEEGNEILKLSYQYDGAGNKEVEEIWEGDKYYHREYDYYKNNTVKSMVETGDNHVEYYYHYDPTGNIDQRRVVEDGEEKTYTYTYNKANRMVEEYEKGELKHTYKYDDNGNRIQRILGGEQQEYDISKFEASMLDNPVVIQDTKYAKANNKDKGTNKEKDNNKGKSGSKSKVEETGVNEILPLEEEPTETADYYYYDYEDRLVEIVLHNGKVFTYGYDGEGNRLWRTHAAYPLVKPPVEDGERLEDPAQFPGWNKNKDNGKDKDKPNRGNNNKDEEKTNKEKDDKDNNGKKKEKEAAFIIEQEEDSVLLAALTDFLIVKVDKKDKDNSSNKNNDKNSDKNNGSSKEKDKGNDKDKNDKKEKDNSKDKDNDKIKGYDKNSKEKGKGWAKGKEKGNRGKHLGWYKNGKLPPMPPGIDLTNPEVFEVTNYINDISQDNTEVLMTTDVDGNYRAAYTYGLDRIGVEDLVKVEGKPNNPLYYLQDALGSTVAITNMNAGIIDRNRFAPYGEPISPVAKNARLTNSPFGFTGEMHDIEARLVYLRARYYEPGTMRFFQQDTVLGEIENPISRNLYAYANDNPVMYTDPNGNIAIVPILIYLAETAAETLPDVLLDALIEGESFTWWKSGLINYGFNLIPALGESKTAKKIIKLGQKYGDNVVKYFTKYSDDIVKHADEIIDYARKNGFNGIIEFVQKRADQVVKGAGELAFKSGKAGEKYLLDLVGGNTQQYFKTTFGRRFIDVLSEAGIAHESKVGYASLTKFIKKQVLKDAELINSGAIEGAVWHFFKSEKTGKIGASKQLLNFLKENGIDYIIHK